MKLSSVWRKQWMAAPLVALALRLFFVWYFPAEAGDTKIYDEMARNWLDYGTYGLFLNGRLTPVGIRMPGYPAFVAAVYAVAGGTQLAVMVMQAVLDVATCALAAVLAARLAGSPASRRRAIAALWLAALCPFVANYAAVLLTEVVSTFLTTLALLLLLAAYQGEQQQGKWFLGGLVTGLATLIRPEAPLLLAAAGLALAARWRRPRDWSRLAGAGLWMAAGLILPLLPWAARNWRAIGRPQFLAPRYAELPGEYVPNGFYDWTQTWLVRYADLYSVWKLEEEPIAIQDLPASAFDSDAERARVAALLEEYNAGLEVPPGLDAGFRRLAGERARQHPLRTYLWIPLERAAVMWFTPRVELLPYSGDLWPPGEKWAEDPVDFTVTVVLGLLNFAYIGLALAGAWRCRRSPALVFVAAFLLVRTAFFAETSTPEPRYLLVCFPVVWALGSVVWTGREPGPAPGGRAQSRKGVTPELRSGVRRPASYAE